MACPVVLESNVVMMREGVVITEDAFLHQFISLGDKKDERVIPIPILRDMKLLDLLVTRHNVTLVFAENVLLEWNGQTWSDHKSIISEYTELKDLLPVTTNPLLGRVEEEEDGAGLAYTECMLSEALEEYDGTSHDRVMKYARIYARRCPDTNRLREIALEMRDKGMLDVLRGIRGELVGDGKRVIEDVEEIEKRDQLIHEVDAMLME